MLFVSKTSQNGKIQGSEWALETDACCRGCPSARPLCPALWKQHGGTRARPGHCCTALHEAAAALHGIAEAVGNQDGREIPACDGGQQSSLVGSVAVP